MQRIGQRRSSFFDIYSIYINKTADTVISGPSNMLECDSTRRTKLTMIMSMHRTFSHSARIGAISLRKVPYQPHSQTFGRTLVTLSILTSLTLRSRLCWEQNVHVIVMLTREVEGAMVKCGAYWSDTVFGPLRLRLVSTEGLVPADERPLTAGFFGHHSLSAHSSSSPRRFPHSAGSQRHYRHHHFHNKRLETVKRIFELTHTNYPEAKPRRIVHLQYLEWPDLNVPDDPRGVLGLIKQVEEAVRESQADGQGYELSHTKSTPLNEVDPKTGVVKRALANSPVLLHCSAGVGRTGGFIAVDAILDAIRREIRANAKHAPSTKPDPMFMDVDPKTTDGTGSKATVPLTMSADVPGVSSQRDAGEFVVRVLVAKHMQANARTGSVVESNSTKFASGTIQWAKHVSDEMGINGVAGGPNVRGEALSSSPPVSISATGSYSMGVSSETNYNNGNYHYNSSSSLGTSLSGTSSSPSKVNAQSLDPLERNIPLHSKAPRSVVNNQRSLTDSRTSAISAPSRTVHASSSASCLPSTSPFINVPQSSSSQSNLPLPGMNIEDESGMHTDDGDIPSSSHNRGTADMFPAFNPAGLSSDGEPPSRSQSPSADELSHVHPSVPPQLHPMPVPTLSLFPTMELPLNDQPTKSFDYKEPRTLHEDFTPPLLTSFDNPIWEVVQDMREQRMSLCQSLRQYVFVHAAIIEGALMVVDEEKEIADGLIPRNSSLLNNSYLKEVVGSRSSSTSSHRHAHHPYMNDAATISSTASTGKRGASPTELLKEDKQGDVMLSKRPSIKRKHCSEHDHMAEDARYPPVPVRVTPSTLYAGGVSAPSSRAMPP